ncbi:uncharacterized protein EV420DRAFT_178678 [Desarmillaria tabescens]|uniref:Uncharacterized protein n=1 Tax=Armillaria tabescens TaxID=1929756 RepID=A0AA39N8P9_ARMTA|nr:uncharacterized protein EV420DRAFT_178678 [Desarmillaria tabescens]KAK0461090.1 hypothetical protein EV420DRAFT_178678 [Desarmillaria tabescens]
MNESEDFGRLHCSFKACFRHKMDLDVLLTCPTHLPQYDCRLTHLPCTKSLAARALWTHFAFVAFVYLFLLPFVLDLSVTFATAILHFGKLLLLMLLLFDYTHSK